ncbi:MAG TPA: hypothetical protein VFJ82_08855 [Longimicrobium sp.]|nr:hypothetical protein [Longimicrobium sp.]
MSSTPADPRAERRNARGDEAERGTFARRIDCDGERGPMRAAPTRGGGLREPGAWRGPRDERR